MKTEIDWDEKQGVIREHIDAKLKQYFSGCCDVVRLKYSIFRHKMSRYEFSKARKLLMESGFISRHKLPDKTTPERDWFKVSGND